MSRGEPQHSESSVELHKLLDRNTPESEALRTRFHRTVLHRYRMGWGKPDVDTAAEIEQLTGGRIAANGWRTAEKTEADKRAS